MLIVEGDAELRGLIAAALAAAGYAAIEAADGASALAACQDRDPDLILLDLALPGLGGHGFADVYRSGLGRAKIIVMSGTASAAETSARIQAAAFLSKPFDMERLMGAVRRVLRPPTA